MYVDVWLLQIAIKYMLGIHQHTNFMQYLHWPTGSNDDVDADNCMQIFRHGLRVHAIYHQNYFQWLIKSWTGKEASRISAYIQWDSSMNLKCFAIDDE